MQSEEKHAICHICLTSRECVEAVTTEVVKFLGLGLDLNISGRLVTCRICSENLQKCFDFKTVCICTEDCINSFRNGRNNVNLDLWEIYLRKNGKEIALSECHTVCRLCMEIAETGSCISLNDEANYIISAKAILERYISEIDLDIIKNPVICISCNESLYSYFNFVKSCLDMKNKIKKYGEIEESKIKPQEDSKAVLQFAAENISNYGNAYADIQTPKNCDGNELRDGIKLELGNLAQREFQQLHVKYEVNEHEEGDGIKVEKLSDIFQKYHENGENCESELKCKNSVETQNDGINFKHEEIDIKAEEDTAGFQDNVLTFNVASALVIHHCKICKFEGKNKRSLKEHLLIHRNSSEVTMHSCEICTHKTKRKSNLNLHMLIHRDASEITMYSCEICTYQTRRHYCLRRHMLTHKNSSEVTMYSCEICTFQTMRKDYLIKHKLTHKDTSEVTMYSCEICTHQTKHRRALRRHMLIHKKFSEVTAYSCEICTYQTKRKDYLRQHMLTHKDTSEVTTYSCEICTYQTKRKSHLRQHILTHKDASKVNKTEKLS